MAKKKKATAKKTSAKSAKKTSAKPAKKTSAKPAKKTARSKKKTAAASKKTTVAKKKPAPAARKKSAAAAKKKAAAAPKRKRPAGAKNAFEIHIELLDISPPIWRRFAVTGGITLGALHDVIQIIMGWTNSHLHEFRIGETSYSFPYPEIEPIGLDERKYRLCDLVKEEGAQFAYVYDFGDDWEHVLEVRKTAPPEPGMGYPVCLAGQRACPPEDCGGPWGYEGMLDALANPEHEDREFILEWLGGGFDPEAFDLDAINEALKAL